MIRTARLTVVFVLLASAALALPARAQDGEQDRMELVIQQMEDTKRRATQQVAGAHGRAWAPALHRGPKPEPPKASWPMRHKWKLAGAAVLALLAFVYFRMDRAWREQRRDGVAQ